MSSISTRLIGVLTYVCESLQRWAWDRQQRHVVAQLFAEALAVFNSMHLEFDVDNVADIPAVSGVGTALTFYRFRITTELARHIRDGTKPSVDTFSMSSNHLSKGKRHIGDGMSLKENRLIVLQPLEAFKRLVLSTVPPVTAQ